METQNLTPKKRRKLSRLMKTPLKLLMKARDMYIEGMNGYSDRIGISSVIGCPTGQLVANALPKSYSLNSTKSTHYNEDYRELVRAVSARGSHGNYLQRQHSTNSRPNTNNNNNQMPRSVSVGIGRIDEDKSCRFDAEIINLKTDVVFTKSRSYAVGTTRTTNGVLLV